MVISAVSLGRRMRGGILPEGPHISEVGRLTGTHRTGGSSDQGHRLVWNAEARSVRSNIEASPVVANSYRAAE